MKIIATPAIEKRPAEKTENLLDYVHTLDGVETKSAETKRQHFPFISFGTRSSAAAMTGDASGNNFC